MDRCSSLFDVVYFEEKNSRCFEDSECSLPDLKLLFFRTLLEWLLVWKNQSFSSILDLLDLCNLYLIYTPLYTPCVLGCLFFDINKSILLYKYIYLYIYSHKRLKDIERAMKGDRL